MQDWGTPKWLYDRLNLTFGPFQVDAAANSTNHLCDKWYGPGSDESDALLVDHWDSPAFCNPPYRGLDDWTEKFYEQALLGVRTVAILPARVGTKWWREGVIRPQAMVSFLTGRIAFEDSTGAARKAPNHDSAIVIYAPKMNGLITWKSIEELKKELDAAAAS